MVDRNACGIKMGVGGGAGGIRGGVSAYRRESNFAEST